MQFRTTDRKVSSQQRRDLSSFAHDSAILHVTMHGVKLEYTQSARCTFALLDNGLPLIAIK